MSLFLYSSLRLPTLSVTIVGTFLTWFFFRLFAPFHFPLSVPETEIAAFLHPFLLTSDTHGHLVWP